MGKVHLGEEVPLKFIHFSSFFGQILQIYLILDLLYPFFQILWGDISKVEIGGWERFRGSLIGLKTERFVVYIPEIQSILDQTNLL